MPSPPILPSTAQIVTPAIDAVVAARPNALGPMNARGRYYAIPTIIGAQTDLALARVADEVRSARLRFASGDALVHLAASEFGTSLPPAPQVATATIQLARWSGLLPAGVIRKGQVFSKSANPTATPLPIAAASYRVNATVYVPQGQSWATVQADAVTPGAEANVPTFVNQLGTLIGSILQPAIGSTVTATLANATQFQQGDMLSLPGGGVYQVAQVEGSEHLALTNTGALGNAIAGTTIPAGTPYSKANTNIQTPTTLFDTSFVTASCEASGGSPGISDPVLVAACKAYARGQFGPVDGALAAGALGQQSVRHSAFFRAGLIPYASGYLADESWASGTQWVSRIAQILASFPWVGFGCRIRCGNVVNLLTSVAATIMLRSTDDLSNTDDIDANVRAQVRAYFDGMPTEVTPDGRPDWYSFRLSTLQAVIGAADPRIAQCSSVAVTDALSGATIAEPSLTFGQSWTPTLTHFFVGSDTNPTDATSTNTYLPPA